MGKTIGVVLALKDKCSPQLKKIADSMGITEKEAKKLQKQAKDLSKQLGGGIKKAATVCGAAIGAVGVATQQLVSRTMEAGDRVDKMSQKIGMSRKSFQEWDYVMSQNGSSVDVLQIGYKKLASTMDGAVRGSKDSVATFKQLGVRIKDNNGALRNQEDVFNDAIRALQNIQNPTQKAILANKLFGKSAIELKPLLNQSADSVDKLKQRANDLGMVMSDEAVDASVKLTDTMDSIRRGMGGIGNYIGAKFLPVIQDFADKFIDNMPKIKKAVSPIIDGIIGSLEFLSKHMELVIGVGTALLSTFMAYQAINGVVKTIKTLQSAIKLVTEAQGIWNAIMLANPIGAIAVGIGLLIAGIVLLIRNWDKVISTVKKAIDTVKGFMGLKPGKKTVEIETKKTTKEDKPKKHALGTSFSSGGPALVGENGPELLNLNKGDSVTPAQKTKDILNDNKPAPAQNVKQSVKNNDVTVNVNIAGNVIGNMEFIQQIKNVLALELKTALAVV